MLHASNVAVACDTGAGALPGSASMAAAVQVEGPPCMMDSGQAKAAGPISRPAFETAYSDFCNQTGKCYISSVGWSSVLLLCITAAVRPHCTSD